MGPPFGESSRESARETGAPRYPRAAPRPRRGRASRL